MHNLIIRIAPGRRILLFLFSLLLLGAGSGASFAQTRSKSAKERADSAAAARQDALKTAQVARQRSLDSARTSRQHILDSTRALQQRAMDSTRAARQQSLDSMKAARKKVTDSLGAMRKYRESKRYRDSVTRAREGRVSAIRNLQKARTDSMKAARQRTTDSLLAIRNAATKARQAVQKKRTDSLGAIRKYRESKRFRDSVAIIKKYRADSMATTRKQVADALAAARKYRMDSLKAARKTVTDSMAAARKKVTDSVAAIRKAKADKLAKEKADREKAQKARKKATEIKMNMALELKIKKKREAWNNEKMLKKKWSLPRQVVQNTFTRYNYYFNANRKMEEAEANMQRISRDNFDVPIALFPYDPSKDSATLASDMDSVIQKASLGIQIHDPRTKWGDDLYLLLGQAYFYKGNFENAANAFRYIVAQREKMEREKLKKQAFSNKSVRGQREEPSVVVEDKNSLLDFLKHEQANNQALLWLARTYTQAGNYDGAESVLDLLGSDSKFPDDLKGRLALEKAFLNLQRQNETDAANQLVIVAADKSQPSWIRRRAAFLAGQLLQDGGRYGAAAEQFALVTDLNPKIDMDFYARKNRAYNLMMVGGSQDEAIASLKSMLRDGKYTAYYEQVYYVLGRLSANSGQTKDAIVYLEKSLESTKTTKKQKASSFAALGNLYYYTGNYEGAKSAYDSAAALSQHAAGDSAVLVAVRRSKVLDQVARPARTIRHQDSLLAMAALSDREQRAIVRRYIRSLEQQREDSIYRAENPEAMVQVGGGGAEPASLSWYFANPTLVQTGMNEFKRKWGNRPLADNWRRASALGAAGTRIQSEMPSPGAEDTATMDEQLDERGLPTEEGLLAFVPSTPEQQEAARQKIQRAYVDLGTAYVRQLEDYPRAAGAIDTLEGRYRDHLLKDEALYVRYLIALRQNNLQLAQQWSSQLQQQYPESKWTSMVRPSEDGSGLSASAAPVATFYDETYGLLQQRQYGEVLSRTRTAKRQYADERYSDRFTIVEAMALAGSGMYDQADTLVSDFIRTHPVDSLKIWAESTLEYIRRQRKLDSINNPKPVAVNTAAPASGTPAAAAPAPNPAVPAAAVPAAIDSVAAMPAIPAQYTYKAGAEHYFVFQYPRMEPRAMGVRAGLTDFNNLKFSGQGLESTVEPLPGGGGLIVTRKFKNAAAAKAYLAQFRSTSLLTREYKAEEYKVFIISAPNFLKLMSDRDIPAYLNFYKSRY